MTRLIHIAVLVTIGSLAMPLWAQNNPMRDENKQLHDQNRELQAQLSEVGGRQRETPEPASSIRFEDMTEKLGIAGPMKGWAYGHGGAWGDADGDGRPDLYFGTFANRDMFAGPDAPLPCFLFFNKPEGFILTDDPAILLKGQRPRVSSALFVDLNNDGRLDLVSANHVHSEQFSFPTTLYENIGNGRFKDVTPKADYWPLDRGVRNVGALDFNNDGLLDLIIADGTYGGDKPKKLFILENKGNFTFEDASAKYGFPPDKTEGLGLAIGDVNNDGVMDIFVAGANRLFVSSPDGKYIEVQPGEFERPAAREALACGANFGDLNGDGLLDLITTVHGTPSRIHLYLNQGITDGKPRFLQVSDKAGVATAFRVRNTHVELRDVDNDGRNDIMLAIIYNDSRGMVQPLVLRNLGNNAEGIPQFSSWDNESLIGYYAPAPVADYDRDGRVDIFMVPWSGADRTPPFLFRNASESGRWLTIQVTGKGPGLNPMGVGAIVRAYRPGSLGQADALLARYDITIGNGYSSGEEALAHLGLGTAESVDLEITWGKHRVTKPNTPTNQSLTIPIEAR